MKSRLEILDYANGMTAFYSYLNSVLGDKDSDPNMIRAKFAIRNAEVAMLALFFGTEKEEIVEKHENCEITSKVIDDALALSIKEIAEVTENGYKIGDYVEKNPAKIITVIRNKFAHGAYRIDSLRNKVILENVNGKVDVSFDIFHLFILVYNTLQSLIVLPKTNKINRIHSMNKHIHKFDFKSITTKEQAKLVLKTSLFKEYTLSSINGEDIHAFDLIYFNNKMNNIRINPNDEAVILEEIEHYIKPRNLKIDIRKKRISEEDIEEILSGSDLSGFYGIYNIHEQCKFLLTKAVHKVDPTYCKSHFLNGLIFNMKLLMEMDNFNEFDFFKLANVSSSGVLNMTGESIVSALLAKFVSTYVYPLEDIYLDGKKYSLDRSKQLDFENLDLSILKPNILEIYDVPLKQAEKNYNSKIKQYEEKINYIEKLRQDLFNVKAKGNQQAISYIEERLKQANEEFIEFASEMSKDIDYYLSVKRDYEVNRKYFQNRALIEGIRNAIFHGNVTMKIDESDLNDILINFKDIYDGKVCLDLDITVLEFEGIFNENNYLVLEEAYEKHFKDFEEKEEPEEFIEVQKENKFKKVLKKVMNFIK